MFWENHYFLVFLSNYLIITIFRSKMVRSYKNNKRIWLFKKHKPFFKNLEIKAMKLSLSWKKYFINAEWRISIFPIKYEPWFQWACNGCLPYTGGKSGLTTTIFWFFIKIVISSTYLCLCQCKLKSVSCTYDTNIMLIFETKFLKQTVVELIKNRFELTPHHLI